MWAAVHLDCHLQNSFSYILKAPFPTRTKVSGSTLRAGPESIYRFLIQQCIWAHGENSSLLRCLLAVPLGNGVDSYQNILESSELWLSFSFWELGGSFPRCIWSVQQSNQFLCLCLFFDHLQAISGQRCAADVSQGSHYMIYVIWYNALDEKDLGPTLKGRVLSSYHPVISATSTAS